MPDDQAAEFEAKVIGPCWLCGHIERATTAQHADSIALEDGLCPGCFGQTNEDSDKPTTISRADRDKMLAWYRLICNAIREGVSRAE